MIRGIIFDYGGTLDTNGQHWASVLWQAYQHAAIPVTNEQFRNAYVHAERELAKRPLIKPQHNYLQLLRIKVDIETRHLASTGHLAVSEDERQALTEAVAQHCYRHVQEVLRVSRPIVASLAENIPLALVTNFYGNMHTVLNDFGLTYFRAVVESAVVGVRKPDPAIFRLGVSALGTLPCDTLVVGDSYGKDIVPAHTIGCKTAWLKGEGWAEEQVDEPLPTWTLTDIASLPDLVSRNVNLP